MKQLIDRIAAARDVAARREFDVRIQEFLSAMTIRQDALDAVVISIDVVCHFRSWHRCILPAEAAQLHAMSHEELAQTIAGWIQTALRDNLLSLSNPPVTGTAPPSSVGAVVTYMFDNKWTLVGSKWE